MIHIGAIHAELEQARSEVIALADLLDHVPMSGAALFYTEIMQDVFRYQGYSGRGTAILPFFFTWAVWLRNYNPCRGDPGKETIMEKKTKELLALTVQHIHRTNEFLVAFLSALEKEEPASLKTPAPIVSQPAKKKILFQCKKRWSLPDIPSHIFTNSFTPEKSLTTSRPRVRFSSDKANLKNFCFTANIQQIMKSLIRLMKF
jgi:hypothetical protein